MAKRRAAPQRPPAASRGRGASNNNRAAGLVLAFVLGGIAAVGAGALYLHSRHAVIALHPHADAPARETTRTAPALARNDRGSGATHPDPPPQALTPPFGASEDVFEAGARVYAARCASCHGSPARAASGAIAVRSPQLFGEAATRTAAQTPAQLYRAIAAGALSRGMPGYAGSLSDHAIWQLVLLLRSAGEPLPDPVTALLDHPGRAAPQPSPAR